MGRSRVGCESFLGSSDIELVRFDALALADAAKFSGVDESFDGGPRSRAAPTLAAAAANLVLGVVFAEGLVGTLVKGAGIVVGSCFFASTEEEEGDELLARVVLVTGDEGIFFISELVLEELANRV